MKQLDFVEFMIYKAKFTMKIYVPIYNYYLILYIMDMFIINYFTENQKIVLSIAKTLF